MWREITRPADETAVSARRDTVTETTQWGGQGSHRAGYGVRGRGDAGGGYWTRPQWRSEPASISSLIQSRFAYHYCIPTWSTQVQMAALVRNRSPRRESSFGPGTTHISRPNLQFCPPHLPLGKQLAAHSTQTPAIDNPVTATSSTPKALQTVRRSPDRPSSPLTAPQRPLSATSSTTATKRRAVSPAARPLPKRSRSEDEQADDSFLALLLPPDMSRFTIPTQSADAWNHRDEDRVILPPIAEDRRASLPSASSSGYVFTNTFESPRPGTSSSPAQQFANNQARRPQMHTRTFSSPALPAHMNLRATNAMSIQEEALTFSPHSIPPGAMDWLGTNLPGRPVSRNDGSLSEFDPSAFGLDSGANSPAFSFGPGPSPFSGFNSQFHPRSQAPLNIAQALASSAGPSPMNSPAQIPIDPSLTGGMHSPTREQLESELGAVRTKIRELEFLNDLLQLRVVELENDKDKGPQVPIGDKTVSPAFEASWEARTEARVKRFCSLNRAGNAL